METGTRMGESEKKANGGWERMGEPEKKANGGWDEDGGT